jgi:pimeloyl-ACP methyl ester carboxylesterase
MQGRRLGEVGRRAPGRGVVLAVLGVALALGLAVVGWPVEPAEAQRGPRWQDCGGGFQCVTLKVPVQYGVRNSPQLDLAVIRQPARDPSRRIGALVVNPGGPGASGVGFVRNWTRSLAPEVQARFDIVGFDPRGVGASSPLRCHDDIQRLAALDPEPVTADEWAVYTRAQREFVELCRTRGGSNLRGLGSVAAARDIEAIRAFLGDERITYLGYSYGTVLGALYADRFPERVRGLVLDGPVDLTLEADELVAQQAVAFEETLDRFIDDCLVTRCSIMESGLEPAEAIAELRDRARRQPIASRSADRAAGPGEAYLGVLQGLYRPALWPVLADAVRDGLAGDGSGLVRLADRLLGRVGAEYDNSYEMNAAVNCVDYRWAKEPAHYEELARELGERAPRFGAAFAASGLVCALWPAPAQPVLPPRVRQLAPSLVVGTTHDPATPFEWALAMRRQLVASTLLTREGDGHTAFLSGNACVDAAVQRYLVSLELPLDGAICDASVAVPRAAATPPVAVTPQPRVLSGPAVALPPPAVPVVEEPEASGGGVTTRTGVLVGLFLLALSPAALAAGIVGWRRVKRGAWT